MAAYFVTGSGTEIGKTFVAAGLLRFLVKQGRAVEALKPVVSGYDPADPGASDPAILLEALGRLPTAENIALISPWRFKAPLSPDMAAAAEGRAVDLIEVTAFCRSAAARKDLLLIEGVGGVMAPLTANRTQLDLMAALGAPVIFVAGTYLGALSHALTGLDALRRRGLELRATIVNETPGASVALGATCDSLENFVDAPVLPLRCADPAANEAAFARLAALL